MEKQIAEVVETGTRIVLESAIGLKRFHTGIADVVKSTVRQAYTEIVEKVKEACRIEAARKELRGRFVHSHKRAAKRRHPVLRQR